MDNDKRLQNWKIRYLLLAAALIAQIIFYYWFTNFWA